MVTVPHIDEARIFLIHALSKAPYLRDQGIPYNNTRPSGADIEIYRVAEQFYSQQGYIIHQQGGQESYYIPFYDAAWELARIGILRPGVRCFSFYVHQVLFANSDGYKK